MKKPMFCAVCKEMIDPNEDYHLGPIDEFYHEECCPMCQEEDGADESWREFLAREAMDKIAEEMGL